MACLFFSNGFSFFLFFFSFLNLSIFRIYILLVNKMITIKGKIDNKKKILKVEKYFLFGYF